jgi:hypothetical protein
MKTNIPFLFIFLFLIFITSCHKQEVQSIAPVEADLATFKATFLGKPLSIVESSKDTIINNSGIGYLLENGQKPSFIHTSAELVRPASKKGDLIFLHFPTIKTEDFTFEGMQRLLEVGKKEFETNPILGKDGSYNFAFKRGYIFMLYTQNPTLPENGFRQIYDTMGEQNGSELKIIESKEVFPPSGYERAIQARFLLNCKLYSGGQFIGNLKEADFTLKFFYKKPNF